MLTHSLNSLLDFTPVMAVLQDSSRFLLTLGVGLFVAYVVLMFGANLLGFAHRQVTKVVNRGRSMPSGKHRSSTVRQSTPEQQTPVTVKQDVA